MPIPKKGYDRNRRQGPDFWMKFIKTVSVAVWGLMLIVLFIVDRAKPEFENLFSRLFDVQLRTNWDTSLLSYAFYLSVLSLFFSFFTLYVNKKRHRRKTDHYSASVLIMIFFSLAIILFYLVKTI